jgi:hydroxymethylpyrimidine pyrophosphatase-like HAD family hydrolase
VAIAELASRGVRTTIATGRLYSGTREAAAVARVEGPVACADGSHLVDAESGRELYHGGIAGEHAARARTILAQTDSVHFLMAQDQIVHDLRGTPHLVYVRTWSRDLVPTHSVTDHPHWEHERGITAVVSVGTRSAIAQAQRDLADALAGAAYLVSFAIRRADQEGSWALLLRAAGHSKGTAIGWMARHYGIDAGEVAAIGDWYNDVPMFEAAGRSFAMAHAPDDVKRSATDQLRANVQTGGAVAEAAERLGLL